MPRNPHPARPAVEDPDNILPGDIVRLDAKYLTPTRGHGAHTWPHDAICIGWNTPNENLPDIKVSGTVFHFVCISSITRRNPLDHTKQIRLDHEDPDLGLSHPSAACVEFAASAVVTVQGSAHVLGGVRRYPNRRVKDERVLASIIGLYNQYWTSRAKPEDEEK